MKIEQAVELAARAPSPTEGEVRRMKMEGEIGKPLPRIDVLEKYRVRLPYHGFKLPDKLYARNSPFYARIPSIDTAEAEKLFMCAPWLHIKIRQNVVLTVPSEANPPAVPGRR